MQGSSIAVVAIANNGRIDVPRRLRRAILLNDLSLVKRILQNNPQYLRNPDFEDKSNTSLHLAAKHGFTQIAVCLDSIRRLFASRVLTLWASGVPRRARP
jgi:hypothetical protein